MTTRPVVSRSEVAALRGLLQLGVSGTVGVASLAQAVHEAVLATAPLPWLPSSALMNGVARLAYGSVRGVAGAVGKGGDSLLAWAERRPGGEARNMTPSAFPVPLGVRAVLNGVVGDRLERLVAGLAIALPPGMDGRHRSGGMVPGRIDRPPGHPGHSRHEAGDDGPAPDPTQQARAVVIVAVDPRHLPARGRSPRGGIAAVGVGWLRHSSTSFGLVTSS